MDSISVSGHDVEMLAGSDSLYFQKPEEPPKAAQLDISRQRGSSFLNLPYELRTHIYSYVLPSTTDHPDRGIIWIRATAAIWTTNRQIYEECIRLMYSNPTFLIDVKDRKIQFLYQWIDPQTSLIPKRTFNFPDLIATRNQPLMRKFHIRVHDFGSCAGMIEYEYSNFKISTSNLIRQVIILCAFLKELHEIRELRISYHQGDEEGDGESHALIPLVIEPFWQLKNTTTVAVQGPWRTHEALRVKLQDILTNAYTKNSSLRLPLELREYGYRHAPAHTVSEGTDDNEVIEWCPGAVRLLSTW